MLEKGKNHLIYEVSTNFTYEMFAEFDKNGIPCICLTTKLPKKLKKLVKKEQKRLSMLSFSWFSLLRSLHDLSLPN